MTLYIFVAIWLCGAVVSYGKYMHVFTECDPHKSLNQTVNHFGAFESLWYENFKEQWQSVLKERRKHYLWAIGCGLLGSWFIRNAIHSNYKLTPGYQRRAWKWRLPPMPDKNNFRIAVLQRRYGNTSWKSMATLKKNERYTQMEN